jgi:hypothetical protein
MWSGFPGLSGLTNPEQLRCSSISSANSDRFDAVALANGVKAKRGMVLPFQPLAMAFHHISYAIDMPAVSPCFLD